MTNQHILTKAIEKAVVNGFGWLKSYEVKSRYGYLNDKRKTVEEVYILEKRDKVYERELAYQVVIFNHDFAEELWGVLPQHVISYAEGARKLDSWQYHLQQMVIADDPIRYLEEHI